MDAGGRRVSRRRSVLAGISLVLACITIVVATVAVWAHQVALNSDRFTALASDVLDDPEVIDPLAARISTQVVTTLDVQSRLANVLPERVTAIAGPVTLALQDGLTRRLETLLAEPRMQQALTRTLAFAHERVMNLLRDRAEAVTVVDGQVVLEVYPALLVALQELQTAGIIAPDVAASRSRNGGAARRRPGDPRDPARRDASPRTSARSRSCRSNGWRPPRRPSASSTSSSSS